MLRFEIFLLLFIYFLKGKNRINLKRAHLFSDRQGSAREQLSDRTHLSFHFAASSLLLPSRNLQSVSHLFGVAFFRSTATHSIPFRFDWFSPYIILPLPSAWQKQQWQFHWNRKWKWKWRGKTKSSETEVHKFLNAGNNCLHPRQSLELSVLSQWKEVHCLLFCFLYI